MDTTAWITLSIASPENIKMIWEHLGSLVEIEPLPFCLACKKCVRIKVELDVNLPLKIGFYFPRNKKCPAHISFQYEKLSDFCYHCGRSEPSISSCELLNSKMDFSYSSDQRVDPKDARNFLRPHQFSNSNSDHPSLRSPKYDFSIGSQFLNSVSLNPQSPFLRFLSSLFFG